MKSFLFLVVVLNFTNLYAQTDTVKQEVKLPIADSQPEKDTSTVFSYVEEMPEFPGGLKAFQKFKDKNFQYPKLDKKNRIEGTVMVKFIINEDGSISNPTIAKSVSTGCDNEAIRLVNLMPSWRPGKQSGKPVKVYFMVPVRFILDQSFFPPRQVIE